MTIWSAKEPLIRRFKLSRDPRLVETPRVYMNPQRRGLQKELERGSRAEQQRGYQHPERVPTSEHHHGDGQKSPGPLPFVPTGASWANIVERLFGELDERQLKRLAVNSVSQLIHAINAYLEHRNEDPAPFVWTKSAKVPAS